jgi:hypothetical protein
MRGPQHRDDPRRHRREFKVYGRASDVQDPVQRTAYANGLQAKIDWRPEDPFHLFDMEIGSVAFIRYSEDGAQHVERWQPEA